MVEEERVLVRIKESRGRLQKVRQSHLIMAQRISMGECLIARDINEILKDLGKTGKFNATEIVPSRFVVETGVPIEVVFYKGRTIYMDPRIDKDHTNLEDVKKRIDDIVSKAGRKRTFTNLS